MNQVIEDRYEIQGYLGQGGMGEVYRALDRHTRDIVAVKSLKADVVKLDPEILARFEREGDALRKLNHPNIVKMLSTCNSDGRHYIVMEYVGGGSLRDLLDDQPRLPVDRVLQIGLDVADALTRAHRLNITHRDIKPENILLAEDGTPRLTDFGVAQMGDSPRMTQAGALVGTLSYLSPEGASGEAVDERADIWSFGLVLYEMLAGQMPFQKPQIGATLNAILNQPTPDLQAERPDVPDALADLIYRMLIKERAARIPSVRLVGAEIEALLHGRESTSQIYGDSTRFGTPAPSSVDVTPSKIRTPSNLPAQTTPFVGRDEELLDILRLLADESVRLITVSGPGGMGKTRLTLEAARLVLGGRPDSTSATLKQTSRINLPSFQHGVFFVPLAPLNAADVIVPTIAESINFAFYNADDPKTQLLNYLREKEMLLVMDNFEHLMDGANIVADILRAAPQVQILVSSRERLRLQGETILDLYGMRFPEYETPRELENYAAVKLFLQSARRAAPDFTLNEQTAPLVARIVRLVEGLPLGIELAAAWLEALSAQEIVQEMQRSFDFLETDLRDVPDRHRSIRSVFEYSWKLLTEAEKTAFGKLSVFRGGFTREAAQTVAEVALRDLTTLVNKSLLRRSPEGRYDVHELLRQYAAEHLRASPTEAEATHTRHSAYFMRLLAQCEKELYTSSQKRILEALETDFDNIRSAWQWASDHALEDLLYEGIGTLSALYETLSMFKEGVETFGKAADLLLKRGAAEDDLTVWRLRVYQGALAGRMGDYALNYQLAQQALNVFQHWDMRPEISYALNNLAYVDMMRGRYDSALEYGEQAMTMAVEVGDQWRVFMSMGNVGYIAFLQGRYEDAKRIYEKALPVVDALDVPIGKAYCRNNLGEVLQAMGDYAAARTLFQEAHDLFKQVNNRRGLAFTLNNLGDLAARLGEYEDVNYYFTESYTLSKDVGDRSGMAASLQNLGYVAWSQLNYDRAREYFQETLAIRKEIGDRKGTAGALLNLGNVAESTGHFEEARLYLIEALEISREIGDRVFIASAQQHLGINYWNVADYPQAKTALSEALALQREIGNPFELSITLSTLAQTLNFLGESEAAIASAQESIALQKNLGSVKLVQTIAHLALGNAYLDLGQLALSRQNMAVVMHNLQEIAMPFNISLSALAIASVLLARSGQLEPAVTGLLFIRQHPEFNQLYAEIQRRITTVLDEYHVLLSPQAAQAVQSRASSISYKQLASEISALLA